MTEAHWQESRQIVERIVVSGDLVLETPACFSSGEGGSLTDIPLMLDPLEGRGLLTGSSIAGALRTYLRQRECGYWNGGKPDALHNLLFGYQRDAEGEQSWLITYDVLSERPQVELRNSVTLDPKTRAAEARKLYDIELLEAGTRFPVRIELLIPEGNHKPLLQGLAIALQGLEQGEIALGVRKRRGFGQCRVTEWRVVRYDLTTTEGLLAWLEQSDEPQIGTHIADLLQVQADLDQREVFIIDAIFGLDSSLLIRSGQGEADEPDMVHLRSRRNGQLKPILSGTSLAGALRTRALRIAQTLGEKSQAEKLVNELFGVRIHSSQDKPTASRLVTAETEIVSPLNLVQTRVKIDRFTGGSYPSALFNEQPVWGKGDTAITVRITIQRPTPAQIGLVLLLLKDLWTGDLPLGGEIGVGRGRLTGKRATLTYKPVGESEMQHWTITQDGNGLQVEGDQDCLEGFVTAFVKQVEQ